MGSALDMCYALDMPCGARGDLYHIETLWVISIPGGKYRAEGISTNSSNCSINCDLAFKFPFIGLLFAQLTPSVRRGDLWSPGVGTENLNILPFKITVLSSKQAGDHRSPLRWDTMVYASNRLTNCDLTVPEIHYILIASHKNCFPWSDSDHRKQFYNA